MEKVKEKEDEQQEEKRLIRSGLFGTEGLTDHPPSGFEKITEGTAALLFPPAKRRKTCCEEQRTNSSKTEQFNDNDKGDDDINNHNNIGDKHYVDSDDQAVFYNPAQVVNRDLSVCVLACFSRLRRDEPRRKGGTRSGITILDALSASGLRAIRYFKELPDVRFIIANDIDPDAVECIYRNCKFNGVPCVKPTLTDNFPPDYIKINEVSGTVESGGAVIPNLDDANDLMFRLAANTVVHTRQRLCAIPLNNTCTADVNTTFNSTNINGNNNSGVSVGDPVPLLQQELIDVVDLDPYGSASPFLDAAIRCVKEGGLLLVTSTDSSVLCGNYPDTCHAKYNTLPVKNAACHEMAVRILLAAIERVANKYQKYIVPLLSLHIDFYVRCFLRVYKQPAEAKLSSCKLGYVFQCSNCPAYWVRPLATVQTQTRKRFKKEKNFNNGIFDGKNVKNNTNNNYKNEESVDDSELTKNETACSADKLKMECFSESFLRQNNPKIKCFGLKSLPSFVNGNSCTVCGAYVSLSGPIYAAPTHSLPFLTQLLQEVQERGAAKKITAEARVAGLIRVAMEELQNVPLFYKPDDIASFIKVRCPPTSLLVGALRRMNYRTSQVHCTPSGLKTDCPPDVLVSVMLSWKKKEKEEEEERKNDTCNQRKNGDCCLDEVETPECVVSIPSKEKMKPKHIDLHAPIVKALEEVDFSYDRQFDSRSLVTGVARFIPNAPYWGPKRLHQGIMRKELHDDCDEL